MHERLATAGLLKRRTIAIDATTLEANAMRSIVRRDTGERYREILTRLAAESGIKCQPAKRWRVSIVDGRNGRRTKTGRTCRIPTGDLRDVVYARPGRQPRPYSGMDCMIM